MADFKGYSKAVQVAVDTLAVSHPCSLLGIWVVHTAAASNNVTLQDSTDSSGGTVAVLEMMPANGQAYIEFPGQGIRCSEGVYVDIGGCESVTIFYG